MSEWTLLGPVIRTQIHTDRMVNSGRYDFEMIVEADELLLGPDGVVGQIGDAQVMHGHHRLHPNKTRDDNRKKFLPARLLSFGFTGHYAEMADRFGHAPIGCAAEDVIVQRHGVVTLDELRGGLQVRRGGSAVDFTGAAVAKPCVPFTKYLLQDQEASDELVAPNRAFLDDGMRGFLVGLSDETEKATIRVGDELWVHTSA